MAGQSFDVMQEPPKMTVFTISITILLLYFISNYVAAPFVFVIDWVCEGLAGVLGGRFSG